MTAHSGRVGLASELTARGASTTEVMLAGNRAELSPLARGEREPFGLNCDRAAAGRSCHPKGRSEAEDGAAVDVPGLRRLSGLFPGLW